MAVTDATRIGASVKANATEWNATIEEYLTLKARIDAIKKENNLNKLESELKSLTEVLRDEALTCENNTLVTDRHAVIVKESDLIVPSPYVRRTLTVS